MAKLAVILGSPREGNSDKIANLVAETTGYDVETFKINDMKNKSGCHADFACKEAGGCVIEDDITKALDAVKVADGVIIATPVFFGSATSQTKMFIDRCFGFLSADLKSIIPAGKKLGAVVTCGVDEKSGEKVAREIEGFGNMFGMNFVGSVIGTDMMDLDACTKDQNLINAAKALGKKF